MPAQLGVTASRGAALRARRRVGERSSVGAATSRRRRARARGCIGVQRLGGVVPSTAVGHAALLLVGAHEGLVLRDRGEQLVVGAVAGDAAALEEQHPVGERDRGDAVGDDQRGGVELAAQPVEDPLLDHRVDRRGGVVEQQQPGAAQQRPGEREALALAAGQRHAPLAHHGVAPAGSSSTKRGLGDVDGPLEALVVDRLAEGEVLAHRVGEQERLLEHERHRAPRRSPGSASASGTPPSAISPAVGSGEAGEQVAQRRLAAAGGADERDDLAGARRRRSTPSSTALARRRRSRGRAPRAAAGRRAAAPAPAVGGRGIRAGGRSSTSTMRSRATTDAGQLLEQEADDPHREGEDARTAPWPGRGRRW